MTASSTKDLSPQLSKWAGEFGDEYIDRNPATEAQVQIRMRALFKPLEALRGSPPRSILECGCNIGQNLRALRRLTQAELFAVEPNPKARGILLQDGVLPEDHLFDATLDQLPFADGSIDFVFTSGVLIHVPPERLPRALDEMYRVSRKYVMAMEYFAKNPETITYRGETELLFKRDFGSAWLDRFPDLIPIDEGFLWSRTTGIDDVVWWLFRKSGVE